MQTTTNPQLGLLDSLMIATGAIAREDVFITTKLWNTNHRPERVEPAFAASSRAWESVAWIFT